ncbi:THUMP domain-containing protein 2 [Pholidichthys leucotaenia]
MSGPGIVRYYCTAGNGMESFLIDELKRKLAAEDVCRIPGKVLFSTSARISRVCDLKAAERLFLLLKQDSPLRIPTYTSPAKVSSVMQSKLLSDKNEWTSAVMTWSRLQGELTHSRTTVQTPGTAMGVRRKRDEARACRAKTNTSTVEQREEDSWNISPWSDEHNGSPKMGKKRKRDDDGDGERNHADLRSSFGKIDKNLESIKNVKDETNLSGNTADCDKAMSGLQDSVGHSSWMEDMVKDFAEEMKASVEKDKPELPVSFRISCKCTGSLSRWFSTQEVSKVIGAGLNRLLGWKAVLKNPQLEVNVSLSDDYCLLGIPLTRLPLANRSYIKITGLRSTVAWAMTTLAQIQPGSCVLDPMCGVGTILVEAAQEHKAASFLGVDIDDGQLQKARENIGFADLGTRVHLLKASSTVLPLPSASVDAVICDLPFGRKFGTKMSMAANLPLILTEMERVLHTGGTLVLLLSPQLSGLLKKCLVEKSPAEASSQEEMPQTRKHNCSSPGQENQTVPFQPGGKYLPTQETGQEHSVLSSLKHQATFRISLGAIDGLIHQYIKVEV